MEIMIIIIVIKLINVMIIIIIKTTTISLSLSISTSLLSCLISSRPSLSLLSISPLLSPSSLLLFLSLSSLSPIFLLLIYSYSLLNFLLQHFFLSTSYVFRFILLLHVLLYFRPSPFYIFFLYITFRRIHPSFFSLCFHLLSCNNLIYFSLSSLHCFHTYISSYFLFSFFSFSHIYSYHLVTYILLFPFTKFLSLFHIFVVKNSLTAD